MDPISHALIGVAIGGLAGSDQAPAVYWGIVAGAVGPDCDIVVRWVRGRHAYLKAHRGPTHSPIGLVLLAAATALVLRLIWPDVALGAVFAWTLVGAVSHVAFDVLNAYGTQALWPWSQRRLALDILQIVELPLVVVFGLAWALAARDADAARTVWVVAWVIVVAYAGARALLHRRCLRAVQQRFAAERLRRVSVVPYLLGVIHWRYVVETDMRWYSGLVSAWPLCVGLPDVFTPGDGGIVEASKAAPAVQADRKSVV